MTEKLKTLKEMSEWSIHRQMRMVPEEDLRAEAIRWVKNLSKEIKEGYVVISRLAQIEWIKHFFNLTEEDLK